MQTAYGHRRARHSRPRAAGAGRGTGMGREGARLAQLLVCLALFLVVFIGKGVFPAKLAQTGSDLLDVIRANTDFRAAFADLGQALADQDSVLSGLGEFCVTVFAPAREEGGAEASLPGPVPAGAGFLTARADQNEMTAQFLGLDSLPQELALDPEEPADQAEPEAETVEEEPVLEVGAVIQTSQSQEELPEGYTLDWLSLGELETVTPVMGTITSGFGYREHPITGTYAVHGGVDIGADSGAQVVAFADGVVEYIGESDDLGLYLQIIHENGVKSFYAHCSQLYVQKGQQVSAGETVAQVGSTGMSTGPHLHFEIKLDGVRLDPVYYIDSYQTA